MTSVMTSQHDLPQEDLIVRHSQQLVALRGELDLVDLSTVTQKVLEVSFVIIHQLGQTFCGGRGGREGRGSGGGDFESNCSNLKRI